MSHAADFPGSHSQGMSNPDFVRCSSGFSASCRGLVLIQDEGGNEFLLECPTKNRRDVQFGVLWYVLRLGWVEIQGLGLSFPEVPNTESQDRWVRMPASKDLSTRFLSCSVLPCEL